MKKKFLCILLAAACVFSMAACGSGGNSAGDSGNTAESDEAAGADDADEASGEDSGSGGTLVMATNAEFPPYEYHEGDEIVGIDADIAAAIADRKSVV